MSFEPKGIDEHEADFGDEGGKLAMFIVATGFNF
jgi:hypothetical protein